MARHSAQISSKADTAICGVAYSSLHTRYRSSMAMRLLANIVVFRSSFCVMLRIGYFCRRSSTRVAALAGLVSLLERSYCNEDCHFRQGFFGDSSTREHLLHVFSDCVLTKPSAVSDTKPHSEACYLDQIVKGHPKQLHETQVARNLPMQEICRSLTNLWVQERHNHKSASQ